MPRDSRSTTVKYKIIGDNLEEAICFIAFKSSLGLLAAENISFLDICSSLHLQGSTGENRYAFGSPSSDSSSLWCASQQLLNTYKTALNPQRGRGNVRPLPLGYSILGNCIYVYVCTNPTRDLTLLLSTPLPESLPERFLPSLSPLPSPYVDRRRQTMKNTKLSSPPGRRASTSTDDRHDNNEIFSLYDVMSSEPYSNSVALFRHGQGDTGGARKNKAGVIFLVIPHVDNGRVFL